MNLEKYLERIDFEGTPKADLATLKRIHRSHAERIPYENLAVQFGTPVSRSPADAFEKIVTERRGGWCYEMNGLLGWALDEIGFSVRRLAGAVMRDEHGDDVVGNHLVLLVDLDRTYLADAGFGDGLIEPAPLEEGAFANGPFACRLEQVGGGWWRYHNDERGGAPSFDFNEAVADEALLERMCRWLQTDANSPFVQNAVVQRWRGGEHLSLRGRVLQKLGREKNTEIISDAAQYVETLKTLFLLDLPAAGGLWPQICARHEALFNADNDAEQAAR